MRVLVALTVNSRHKVLKGTAVERERSRALALLVLLNGLQHHLLLKEGKTAVTQMQIAATLRCMRMPAKSCMAADVATNM